MEEKSVRRQCKKYASVGFSVSRTEKDWKKLYKPWGFPESVSITGWPGILPSVASCVFNWGAQLLNRRSAFATIFSDKGQIENDYKNSQRSALVFEMPGLLGRLAILNTGKKSAKMLSFSLISV